MNSKRLLKDVYCCSSIVSKETLYPLQKWYNCLLEKTADEITVSDVTRMLRQKIFLDLAIEKALFFLTESPLAGDMYDGELLEMLFNVDVTKLNPYYDATRHILGCALAECGKHDWLCKEEEQEFLMLVHSFYEKFAGEP